jgi:hypothetical protein
MGTTYPRTENTKSLENQRDRYRFSTKEDE